MFLKWLLEPPVFEDANQTRRAALLHTINRAGFVAAVVLLCVNVAQRGYTQTSLNIAVFIGLSLLIFWMLWRGFFMGAVTVSIGILWLGFSVLAIVGPLTYGVYSSSYSWYILPMLIASLLISETAGLFIAVLSTTMGFGMVSLGIGSDGLSDAIAIERWVFQSALFYVALVLTNMVLKSWREAVEEAKREGQARVQTEEIYHLLVENSLQGLMILQKNRIVFANRIVMTTFDYTVEELLAMEDITLLVHPEDRQFVLERMQARLQGEAVPTHYEFRVVNRQGETRWLEVFISLLVYQGELAAHAAFVDISERKAAESALYRHEARTQKFQDQLRLLHEITLELSKIRQIDTLCRRAVEAGREKLGFDRLGLFLLDETRTIMQGMFGTDQEGRLRDERGMSRPLYEDMRVMEALERKERLNYWTDVDLWDEWKVVGKGWSAMAVLWDGDEGIGWLACDNLLKREPIEDYQLEILTLYGSVLGHLLTRLKAELELIRSEERFVTAFQANPSAVSISRLDGTYVDVNQRWLEMLGYSREEVIGRTGIELNIYVQAGDRHEIVERLDYEGQLENVEIAGRTKSGRSIIGLMAMSKIDVGGDPYYLTMVQDITPLKIAEQQRLELALAQERLNLLTEFVDKVAHDLKTPLGTIEMCLHLIDSVSDVTEQQYNLQQIRQQTVYLEKYIQDILTVSRLNNVPVTLNPVDVNQLLKNTLKRLHVAVERKQLTMAVELDSHLPPIWADENELDRMMVNLIENAVNYTPAGGVVMVRTMGKDKVAIIEVSDTGIGIAKADLPHIFERFFRSMEARQVERRGTGLGLAIVKRIVDIHHGKIDVQSVVGQGSTFRVQLPYLSAQ